MLKRVCDRCGKIIEPRSGNGQLKAIKPDSVIQGDYYVYDLCSRCYAGFHAYMANKYMFATGIEGDSNETI